MRNIYLLFFMLFATSAYCQFVIDAEIRPRMEFRNGYKQPLNDGVDPAAFIDQRSRLNVGYTHDLVKVYLSFQDVRVWGDASQLSENSTSTALHQAWADINLQKNWSLKLGRQEVAYDDHRMFGNVGWAQIARSHDMAKFRYANDNKLTVDVAFAYNQDGASLSDNIYTTPKSYKNMQYVWLHKDYEQYRFSVLAMNKGDQGITYDELGNIADDKTYYNQTIGGHFAKYKGDFTMTANLFGTFGKNAADQELSSMLAGVEAKQKLTQNWGVLVGAEYQSGTDQDETSNKNHSFNPFFGTNHKFNGLMDYFFVGNHLNNVGLMDAYIGGSYSKNKFFVGLNIHNFNAPAKLIDQGDDLLNPADDTIYDSRLGAEVDLTLKYKLNQFVTFQGGYSQMFATESMDYLKSTNGHEDVQNWAYLMVTIKPVLFKN